MFAIIGGAGKIGYATCSALREAGRPVRAILRNPSKAGRLNALGYEVAFADLQDPVALGRAIAGADTVQIILPPAPQAEDGPGVMRETIESLVYTLEQARPNRILAISDYGAHVREDIGMPSLFREFEERLRRLDIPRLFLRSAEHMEGWGRLLPAMLATGTLPSFHQPVTAQVPIVSAPDVGLMAADLLRAGWAGEKIVHAEGPRRYSPLDVAAAFSQLLGRPITPQAMPRVLWQESLERVMHASTARLLIGVYSAHQRGRLIDIEPGVGEVRRGTTELIDALRHLVTQE